MIPVVRIQRLREMIHVHAEAAKNIKIVVFLNNDCGTV